MTASPSSIRHDDTPPGDQLRLRRVSPGLNVVRPRAARCGRSTLTPAAPPALTGTYPEEDEHNHPAATAARP